MADSNLTVNVNGEDKLSPVFDQLQSKLIRFVGAVSSAMTAIQIGSFPVQAIRSFEKEMADVQKTTNFTDIEIKQLSESLIDMSRRINVSAADLAKIAAAAGQQGLGREGVAGVTAFTESVSRMASVLDITVEEAGTNIGKIASIFKIPLRDIERAVSAFNQASNNSTASGEQLLDVVKRIGDAAGSLNLEQSIGIASTGIDLGLSPEVVGTSFSAIFANMYSQADTFSKLLGKNVKDWVSELQKDGVQALKDYLAAIRKLAPEEQQKIIKKLSGGGRIGVLVTKLARDADNALLDQNLASSVEGYRTGTSAIKEQQTVLKTLDAQIKKASNSFQDLGIKAGERFVKPLAGYFAQLNDALAQPSVISFAEAIGDSFKDLFNSIANGIKFVASLNINWENFVSVAKVFAQLKLAQIIGGMALQVTGLSGAFARLAGGAVAAAEAQDAQAVAAARAAKLGEATLSGQIARTKELMAQVQSVTAAREAEAAAAAKVAAAQKEYDRAQSLQGIKKDRLNSAQGSVNTASAAVSAAQSGLTNAQEQAAKAATAAAAARDARLEQAEVQHQQRLLAIQTEWQARQQAGRDNGSRAEVLAATRWRKEQETLEDAYYARSLRGIEAYQARKIAMVQAAGAQQVAAEQATLAASMANLDKVTAASGITGFTNSYKQAGDEVTKAKEALDASKVALENQSKAATLAGASMNVLSTGVRFAAGALRTLVAIAGKAFFWFTVIYTALDAFGVLDKLGPLFQKLTDSIGLTSEANRKAAQEAENHRKELEKQEEQIKANTEALKGFVDATGRLSNAGKQRIDLNLGSDDPESYKKGVQDLIQFTESASQDLANKQASLAVLPDSQAQRQEQTRQLQDELAKQEAALKQAKEVADSIQITVDPSAMLFADSGVTDIQAKIDEIKKKLEQAQKDAGAYTTTTIGQMKQAVDGAADNVEQARERIQKLFTPESAAIFDAMIPPYIEALEKQQDAKRAADAAEAEYNKSLGTEYEEQNKAALQGSQERLALANAAVTAAAEAMDQKIEELKAKGGLSEAVIGSLDNLKIFQNTALNLLTTFNKQFQLVKQNGQFTGENAGPATTPTSGNDKFNVKTDAEARREARARLELARAQINAEAALKKEALDEQQKAEDHAYQNGLTSIKDYYASRLSIMRAQNDVEMSQKQQELKAVQEELDAAKQESDRLGAQASLTRVQGDIALLTKQREALNAQTDRDLSDAYKAFGDKVAQQRRSLTEYFGGGTDEEEFQSALDAAVLADRDFIKQLQANAADMPELLPVIDSIKQRQTYEAVEAVMTKIRREGDLTQRSLTNSTNKISALQDAGLLTTQQAMQLNRQAMQSEVDFKEQQIQRYISEMALLDQSSTKYKEYAQDVKDLQNEIEILKLKGDEVAKDINQSLSKGMQDALKNFETGKSSFGDALIDAVAGIGNGILDQINKAISENVLQAIGSVGSGGFGGFVSSLLGTAENKLGSTPMTPLYIKDVDATLGDITGTGEGGGLLDTAKNALGLGGEEQSAAGAVADVADKGFFTEAFEGLSNTFSGVGNYLSTAFTGVGGSIVDGIGGGLNLLMSIFQSVGSAIVAAIFSSQAAESTSNAISSVGAFAAAHGGGIAGRTTMTRSNIGAGVFANALRYHTGGTAGLQPNEVPIIAEKGEEILTKSDPRHRDNLGKGGGASGDSDQTVFNVLPVMSEDVVLDAMKGSKGERLLVVHMQRNPAMFRQALKIDK